MNTIDKKYQQLLSDIIEFGVEKNDRTGTGTISEFGHQIRHKMSEGFPLLTTKKMHWNSIVTELLWFLRGDTNIKFLLDYDCHIWDGDAYKNFQKTCQFEKDANHILPDKWMTMSNDFMNAGILSQEEFINKIKTDNEFAKQWGELGPIYGKQWRSWGRKGKYVVNEDLTFSNGTFTEIDQIQNLINELKTNPDSRRLMVSAWNVAELDQMVLPPCHYGFQVYTRELSKFERSRWWGLPEGEHFLDEVLDKYNIPKRAISLMWNQRSVDTFLGLPFNIASYALLLEIIAKEVNMIPDELIGNLGDVHLYKNHIEQAKEQISREPYSLPKVEITERNWYQHEKVKENLGPKTFSDKILSYRPDCFELIGYESHPKIKAPLSN
jgi:thymidylate synthase